MILSEQTLEFGGKVYVRNLDAKVARKIPLGVLNVKITLEIEPGKNREPSGAPYSSTYIEYPVGYAFEDIGCVLRFGEIPLSHSFARAGPVQPHMAAELSFQLRISQEDLMFIESVRQDDVTLNLILEGMVKPYRTDKGQPIGSPTWISLSVPWKLSQSEWTKLLSELGYSERWIVEVERPKLEGFHEVVEFLQKAEEGLLNNAPPEAVISDLRAAWDMLDPYIDKFKEDLKRAISAGSRSEEGQPTKDERVENITKALRKLLDDLEELRKAVDKFAQIGPHKEVYTSTRDDALLAYRLTVSLISYYSKLLSRIERESR